MLVEIPDLLIAKLKNNVGRISVESVESNAERSWGDCSVYYNSFLKFNDRIDTGSIINTDSLQEIAKAMNQLIKIIDSTTVADYQI
ncbi:MAG: hypothetical protein M0R50_09190 [Candidatus Cloacimonetes bacterium]|jgi:hypothetical protein|nr:hypothetical protein [Candidatus Cloacimonadota bacterium]